MDNIFLGQPDPLLARVPQYQFQQPQQQSPTYLQIQEYMAQQQQKKDWISELDSLVKTLDEATISELSANKDYSSLSSELQRRIQEEIVILVKARLNDNPDVIDNVRHQIDIIKKVKEDTQTAQRRNLSDLNDYMSNYSHLTFDEYRAMKSKATDSVQKEANK